VIERRPHKRLVDIEQLGGEGDEIVDRKPAMTIVRRLLQGEGYTARSRCGASRVMPIFMAIASAVRKPMPLMSRARRYGSSVIT